MSVRTMNDFFRNLLGHLKSAGASARWAVGTCVGLALMVTSVLAWQASNPRFEMLAADLDTQEFNTAVTALAVADIRFETSVSGPPYYIRVEEGIALSSVFRCMRVLSSSLTAERARIVTIAKNIANARVTRMPDTGLPYQREELSFAPILMRVSDGPDQLSGTRVDEILKDDAPFEEVYDPCHPDADARGVVLYPKVNTMKEMADLVTAVRSYEANLSVQDTFERMADRALRLAE